MPADKKPADHDVAETNLPDGAGVTPAPVRGGPPTPTDPIPEDTASPAHGKKEQEQKVYDDKDGDLKTEGHIEGEKDAEKAEKNK